MSLLMFQNQEYQTTPVTSQIYNKISDRSYDSFYTFKSMLPFYTGFNHVAGHQLQPGFQVFAKLLLWPVEISNERLQSV